MISAGKTTNPPAQAQSSCSQGSHTPSPYPVPAVVSSAVRGSTLREVFNVIKPTVRTCTGEGAPPIHSTFFPLSSISSSFCNRTWEFYKSLNPFLPLFLVVHAVIWCFPLLGGIPYRSSSFIGGRRRPLILFRCRLSVSFVRNGERFSLSRGDRCFSTIDGSVFQEFLSSIGSKVAQILALCAKLTRLSRGPALDVVELLLAKKGALESDYAIVCGRVAVVTPRLESASLDLDQKRSNHAEVIESERSLVAQLVSV